MMGMSPLTGALVRRFSTRSVALAGAVICGAGMALGSQSTQLWHVAMAYGVMSGIGFSLAYVPSIVVLAHYWTKKRSLATGIAVAGSGTGTLVMAAVTDALLVHFSWQQAMLIVGMLAMCVIAACACLYLPPLPPLAASSVAEPAAAATKPLPSPTATGKQDTLPFQPVSQAPGGNSGVAHGHSHAAAGGVIVPRGPPTSAPLSRGSSGELNQNPIEIEFTPVIADGQCGDQPMANQDGAPLFSASDFGGGEDPPRPPSGDAQGGVPAGASDELSDDDAAKHAALLPTCGDPGESVQGSSSGQGSSPAAAAAPLGGGELGATLEATGDKVTTALHVAVLYDSLSDSDGNDELHAKGQHSEGGACAPVEPPLDTPCDTPQTETMVQVLCRLWRIKKYRCLVFALGPTALGYLSPYTHLKAYAISPALDLSGADAALALSAVGIASVVGRVLMGRVADMSIGSMPPHVVRNWLFLLSGFGASLSVAALGAAFSFGGLVAAALGFGVFSGAILSVMPVITADAVGVADLPVALPNMYFVQVPGFIVGAPITGWVKVAVDSYRPAFALSGGLMLFGALALLPLAWDRTPRADDREDNAAKCGVHADGTGDAAAVLGEVDTTQPGADSNSDHQTRSETV